MIHLKTDWCTVSAAGESQVENAQAQKCEGRDGDENNWTGGKKISHPDQSAGGHIIDDHQRLGCRHDEPAERPGAKGHF